MDEKATKIEELGEKLRKSNRIVECLKAKLCREKLLNDKLLQLERHAATSHPVTQTNITGSPFRKEGPDDVANDEAKAVDIQAAQGRSIPDYEETPVT